MATAATSMLGSAQVSSWGFPRQAKSATSWYPSQDIITSKLMGVLLRCPKDSSIHPARLSRALQAAPVIVCNSDSFSTCVITARKVSFSIYAGAYVVVVLVFDCFFNVDQLKRYSSRVRMYDLKSNLILSSGITAVRAPPQQLSIV